MIAFRPDAVLVDGEFRPDRYVVVNDDGRFSHVDTEAPADTRVERRPCTVWMPGFVNAHSHVFQRAMRGRGERRRPGATFWSWRESMYRLVGALDPEAVEVIARYAYEEMLDVGYTVVREFHYLHHRPDGSPYADVNEMARRVIRAAAASDLELELYRVMYLAGDDPAQRRFRDADVDSALRHTAALAASTDVVVGVAPHSIRACTPAQIARASGWALGQGVDCHIHIAEQPREVEFALTAYGKRPLAALETALGAHVVGVHMTHLDDHEVVLAGESQMTACICPTTEGSLGDGLPRLRELLDAGTRLAIGSDSHAVIDPFAEVRLLETNERNRNVSRQMVDPGEILSACTEPLAPGRRMGWLELDRLHPSLVGVPDDELVSAVVLSGRPDCLVGTWRGRDFRPRHYPDPTEYLQTLARLP